MLKIAPLDVLSKPLLGSVGIRNPINMKVLKKIFKRF